MAKTFYNNLFKGIIGRAKNTFKNPHAEVNIDWFYLKYLKHLPADKIHTHKLFGNRTFFYGGPEYLHGLQEIFIEGVYNQVLPENAYVLDCGAHIGLSVLFLKRICQSANIVAFEPDIQNYSLIQKNISSHHLTGVTLKNEAVWIENTTLNFIQDGNMGSKIGTGSSAKTIKVPAIRLKDYLETKIDFLKLDIEGAEYNVIKDIQDKLHYVTNMFIEYHGTFSQNGELVEIFDIIDKAGFRFYIKEAANNYKHPFLPKETKSAYDLQLNIFCFRIL